MKSIEQFAEEKFFLEKDYNWQTVNTYNSNGHLGQLLYCVYSLERIVTFPEEDYKDVNDK